MTDDKKPAEGQDAKPAKAAAVEDDGVRDFATFEAAQECADRIGGAVEHIGVAFHVAEG